MQKNNSLTKLKSIAHFLKVSGRYNFQNYNLSLFIKFLEEDSEISTIINNLLSKYPELKNYAKNAIEKENDRPRFDGFERWVAFCIFYIQEASVNRGNSVIERFIVDTYDKKDDDGVSPKLQFYNDCIEPIIIYLELQIKQKLNAIYILQRYKVLCEWYEREDLFKKCEVNITKKHLAKYLFDQGFTYSLFETTVPSGRIDNFAFNQKKGFGNLPDAIIVEAKIFKGNNRDDILKVKNQLLKRIKEFSFSEGFCVIFNKSKKKIILNGTDGMIQDFSFLIENNKHIYFIVINLNEIFYDSTYEIKTIEVRLKQK